jgi:MFS family permease
VSVPASAPVAVPMTVTPHPLRWLWLAGAAFGVLAIGIASASLAPALPVLIQLLHVSPAGLRWFAGSFPLVLALLVGPGVVLGDLLGHVRVYLLGAIVFAVACVIGAEASMSFGLLLVARIGQGAGAALMLAQSIGYAVKWLGRTERIIACGLFAFAYVGGSQFGSFLSTVLASRLVWNGTWWIAFALALVSGALAAPLFTQRLPLKVDGRGLAVGALAFFGAAIVMIPSTASDVSGWPLFYLIPLIIGAAVLAAAVVLEVRRHGVGFGAGAPIVALLVAAGGAHLSMVYVYLQIVLGFGYGQGNLISLIATSGAFFGAAVGVVLAFSLDQRVATVAGALLIAVGALLTLSTLDSGGYLIGATDATLSSFGLALLLTALVRARTTAPVLVFVLLPIGGALGAELMSLLAVVPDIPADPGAGDVRASSIDSTTATTHAVALACLILLVAAAAIAFFLGPKGRSSSDTPAA